MEAIVQLGFELDIYLPDELAGMYWYLSLLAEARRQIIAVILKHLTSRLSKAESEDDRTEISKSINLHRSMYHSCRGTEALASALSNLYIHASYHKLLPQTAGKSSFYKPELRFELRMKPFLGIKAPKTPNFDEFAQVVEPFGPYNNEHGMGDEVFQALLKDIGHQVNIAKEEFTKVKVIGAKAAGSAGLEDIFEKNIGGLIWSCIATNVAVARLSMSSKEDGNVKVTIELPGPGGRKHEWWIVPTIKKEVSTV